MAVVLSRATAKNSKNVAQPFNVFSIFSPISLIQSGAVLLDRITFSSNVTEVESRTQGSRPRPRTQKNPRPRPRPAYPRTDILEAKDRHSRGQSQGPRTQPQVFSEKKKVFKKVFQAFSNSLA